MKGEYRLRIQFSKASLGRWLSHLEIMRTLERIVRRSGMPYAVTQGFNPHMKLAMGPALPVGTASETEYLDLWVTEFVEPDEVLRRLQEQSPRYVQVLKVGYVSNSEPSLNAALTLSTYRAEVAAPTINAQQVSEGFARIRALEELEVVQKGKTKRFDPALCIPNDAEVRQQQDSVSIHFSLRIDSNGSLRPDALIDAVFREADASYSHLNLERTGLYMLSDSGEMVHPL